MENTPEMVGLHFAAAYHAEYLNGTVGKTHPSPYASTKRTRN